MYNQDLYLTVTLLTEKKKYLNNWRERFILHAWTKHDMIEVIIPKLIYKFHVLSNYQGTTL